jgi:Rad3-related DNA helicase
MPNDLASLGLTPPEWEWRAGQQELAEMIANSPKKIIMLEAECGSGKSIIPTSAAIAADKTAIVLTQTIQLQEQYLNDIQGLILMNGRSHSECNLTFQSAKDAPCTVGAKCSLKGTWSKQGMPLDVPTCHYFKRKAAAARAKISIHNYAYWLHETDGEKISAFGQRDWIICDEGHDLDQILMSAAIVEFRLADMKQIGVPLIKNIGTYDMKELRLWVKLDGLKALQQFKKSIDKEALRLGLPFNGEGEIILTAEMYQSKGQAIQLIVKALQVVQRVTEAFNTIRELKDEDLEEWVICEPDRNNKEWSARPIYGKYGFKRILDGAKEKVIIMSAYLAPTLLMKNLGLKEEDVEVIIGPKVFNRVRSLILYCPTVRVNYKITPRAKQYLFAVMDAFLAKHHADKGLIHVPSVKMRDELLTQTRYRSRIISYDGRSNEYARFKMKDAAIADFVADEEPKVLLGQSISTGLDLPNIPQWQIITKLSFPPTTDPVIAKRKEVDPFFYDYYTICQIVQTAGRVKRTQEHNGPTIILDESFKFFWAKNGKHFPQWFKESMRIDGWKYYPDIAKMLPRIGAAIGYVP